MTTSEQLREIAYRHHSVKRVLMDGEMTQVVEYFYDDVGHQLLSIADKLEKLELSDEEIEVKVIYGNGNVRDALKAYRTHVRNILQDKENSTIFTTCGGSISLNNGMCDICGQRSMTTGTFCGRLIQVHPESIDPLTAYKKALRERIEDMRRGSETVTECSIYNKILDLLDTVSKESGG